MGVRGCVRPGVEVRVDVGGCEALLFPAASARPPRAFPPRLTAAGFLAGRAAFRAARGAGAGRCRDCSSTDRAGAAAERWTSVKRVWSPIVW